MGGPSDNNGVGATWVFTVPVNSGSVTVTTSSGGGGVGGGHHIISFFAVLDFAPTDTLGAISVVTQGSPNLDFAAASGGTCTTGTAYSPGQACSVNANVAPIAPGLRGGAIVFGDSSNPPNVLGTIYVQALGQSPAIAFGPGIQTTLPTTGLNSPSDLIVDAAGDLFIADAGNNGIWEIAAGTSTLRSVASGLDDPTALAMDGAGNLFIVESTPGSVVEVPAGGGAQKTIASGLISPQRITVDGAGNLFVADNFNGGRVLEIPADGGLSSVLIDAGLSSPSGLAVDGSGNLFIADTNNGRILKISPGFVQTTIVSGLSKPVDIAVDAAGDLYVADTSTHAVSEIPNGGGAPLAVGSGFNGPNAIALDAVGDVFIADSISNQIVEVNRSQSPTLTFAPTVVGNTSSDSPKSVTIQNIGNQPLNAIAPGLAIGSNFQTGGTCSITFSLAPGATCNLSISFKPQSGGATQQTAVLTDNALNANPSIQTITLQGTPLVSTFTMTANPTTETVYRGIIAGFMLTLKSVNGFRGDVKLSCSGGPAGS